MLEFASVAAVRSMWPAQSQAMIGELLATGFRFPHASTMKRARPRFDIACMCMERAEWACGRYSRDASAGKRSIHLYADSSPNTGSEIFGMIFDVVAKGKLFRTLQLPGSVLGHGFMSAVDKTMAVLWAVFLSVGPMWSSIEEFLYDVRSFTSDCGVESLISDTKNIAQAFAESLNLKVSATFQQERWLLPSCVYIPDWNHLASNAMKAMLQSLPRWPALLSKLRALCAVFRNAEYRYVMTALVHDEDPEDLLKTFSSSFVKWRYETVDDVLSALLKLRRFCQNDFSRARAHLGHVQNEPEMQNAVEACGDESLWRWIATVQPIMRQFNEFRQWARGCPCHEAERRDGVKVDCERSSRRLAEAFEKVAVFPAWVLTTQRQMTPAMCEGDHDLLIETKRLLLLGHQEIEKRFQWVFQPPYLFAYCRIDPDAAVVYLETTAKAPFADLHRCTQYQLERFRVELERAATGQLVVYSQACLQEEAVQRVVCHR